jgi:hypothetical protein
MWKSLLNGVAALILIVGVIGVLVVARPWLPGGGAAEAKPSGATTAAEAESNGCSVRNIMNDIDVAFVQPVTTVQESMVASVEKDVLERYPKATIVDRLGTTLVGTGLPPLNGKTVVLVAATGREVPSGVEGSAYASVPCTVVVYDANSGAWELTYSEGVPARGPVR